MDQLRDFQFEWGVPFPEPRPHHSLAHNSGQESPIKHIQVFFSGKSSTEARSVADLRVLA